MAEIITKLSSSATQWIYKSADGFARSTVFGTGSGDTHQFTGSLNVSNTASFSGPVLMSFTSSTASALTASAQYNFLALSSSGPTVVELPTVYEGLEITVADASGSAGASAITISASSGDYIQGAASLSISVNYGAVTFLGLDNINWIIKATN
jgi:hypothetical protein